jgi:hypothetical protein
MNCDPIYKPFLTFLFSRLTSARSLPGDRYDCLKLVTRNNENSHACDDEYRQLTGLTFDRLSKFL